MVFSASSQVIIISPILPRIGAVLGIEVEYQGWLITSYAVMLCIFALITGPISDKFGRRRVLLVGSGAMAVALTLHGLAGSFFALAVVRAMAGAAGGVLSGAAVAYVGDYFPYERRGWANGWIMSGIAVGQIIGVPIGTILAEWFNFRWAFLMFAATMYLATVLVWRFVPQPDVARDRGRLTMRTALRTYAGLLRRPHVVAVAGAYFLMFFGIGLYVVYFPTWLENTLSVSGETIAAVFFFGGIANVITGPMAGQVSDRIGRKPLIVSSCIGLGLMMVATTFLVSSAWSAYAVFALIMVMVAMRISPLQSLMTALVPAERRGALMSLAIAVGQLGIGIGSALAGMAYTRFGFLASTILAALSIMMMAALVHFFLPEPRGEAVSA